MADDLLDELLNSKTGEYTGEFEKENEKLRPLLTEINYIYDQGIRHFVRAVLLHADTFWKIPSSFSGKYHPADEHGPGGNVLHTQRVVRTAVVLANAQERTPLETDILVAGALLHDLTKGCPQGDEVQYDPLHPYTVDKFVSLVQQHDEEHPSEERSTTLFCDYDVVQQILRLIRCSHGRWSPIPETYPVSSLEWALHYSDLISSKLDWIVDGDFIKEARWAVDDE